MSWQINHTHLALSKNHKHIKGCKDGKILAYKMELDDSLSTQISYMKQNKSIYNFIDHK